MTFNESKVMGMRILCKCKYVIQVVGRVSPLIDYETDLQKEI